MKYQELLKRATPLPYQVREGGNTFHTQHINAGSKKICLLNANKCHLANAKLLCHSANVLPKALEALNKAIELLEDLHSGMDYLGTGGDSKWAKQLELADLEKIKSIKSMLAEIETIKD